MELHLSKEFSAFVCLTKGFWIKLPVVILLWNSFSFIFFLFFEIGFPLFSTTLPRIACCSSLRFANDLPAQFTQTRKNGLRLLPCRGGFAQIYLNSMVDRGKSAGFCGGVGCSLRAAERGKLN